MDSLNNACKLGSDAWLELQAFKTRQLNRREKLNRHKNLHNTLNNTQTATNSNHDDQGNNFALDNPATQPTNQEFHQNLAGPSSQVVNVHLTENNNNNYEDESISHRGTKTSVNNEYNLSGDISNDSECHDRVITSEYAKVSTGKSTHPFHPIDSVSSLDLDLIECLLLLKLCDVALKLPIDSKSLQRSISKVRNLEATPKSTIENLLQKFAHQELITIEEPTSALLSQQRRHANHLPNLSSHIDREDDEACIYVTSADHTKLVEFDKSFGRHENLRLLLIESRIDDNVDLDIDDSRQLHSASSASGQSAQDQKNHTKKRLTDGNSSLTNIDKHKLTGSDHAKSRRSMPSSEDDIESLLSLTSTREKESKKLGEELLELLSKPTAKERNLLESFRSADGYRVQEFCPKGTKGECIRHSHGDGACDKLHFKKIIAKHTEESLGDCSFLNTCFHMDSCKYVHYEVDYDKKDEHKFKHPQRPADQGAHGSSLMQQSSSLLKTSSNQSLPPCNTNATANLKSLPRGALHESSPQEPSASTSKFTLNSVEEPTKNRKHFKTVLYPPQWIQCDLRFFDMSLLGKFSVIMADPPWDIHMELPYGTMSDDEMRKLNIPALQDEGVIFLWVTGRAMELGRECLSLWGYDRCDEIIWVKTNQLQRIIRTGRTGHWLNHGKEHCLVGVKGNPKDINRGLDCDVIVAEVRATSHKPDEIYGIIERLSPGTRKIELFGRAHNVQPNWITLGNQLNGVRLIEPNLVNAFKKLNPPLQTSDHKAQ